MFNTKDGHMSWLLILFFLFFYLIVYAERGGENKAVGSKQAQSTRRGGRRVYMSYNPLFLPFLPLHLLASTSNFLSPFSYIMFSGLFLSAIYRMFMTIILQTV